MRTTRFLSLLIMMMVAGCSQPAVDAEFSVPLLFSDGMVAQRDVPFPVWGTAPGGTAVTVMLGAESVATEADREGHWRVEFEARPAGGSFELRVSTPSDELVAEDVTFGDVWVASGQSNMAWTVAASADAEAEIAAGSHPAIRHFKVPNSWSWEPESRLEGGAWVAASPETVGQFSAVAYYFARSLREQVDVPIGIVNTSWGGSRIEPWMKAEALGFDGEAVDSVRNAHAATQAAARAALEAAMGPLPDQDAGLVDGEAVWADPDLDDSGWSDMAVPARWENEGYPGLDGLAWYRTRFMLTAAEVEAGDVTLHLGAIDDADMTWLNGIEVGGMAQWNVERDYAVADDVLREGENVLTVRVEDFGYGGGFHSAAGTLLVRTSVREIPLAGTWSFRVGEARTAAGPMNQVPMVLYNKMVHPMLDYPVKGFLWYQGESNSSEQDAGPYAEQFKTLIRTWREDWATGPEAPFLFVQLANFMAALPEPSESSWAVLRESQSEALSLPAVGQAVTIDIGEADDIHPRNKQDVGRRLALAARHIAYGEEDLVYSGPGYAGHRVQGSQVIVEFDHAGSGLVVQDLPLGGFALAGADGVFHWADGRVLGNTVVLSSDQVQDPVSVRYAWANNPDRANLYNRAGLPAAPFRTDGAD